MKLFKTLLQLHTSTNKATHPPTWDQVVKFLSLWGTFSFKPLQGAEQRLWREACLQGIKPLQFSTCKMQVTICYSDEFVCMWMSVCVWGVEWISYSPHWHPSHYVAEGDPELLIILPSSPKCWDFRHVYSVRSRRLELRAAGMLVKLHQANDIPSIFHFNFLLKRYGLRCLWWYKAGIPAPQEAEKEGS